MHYYMKFQLVNGFFKILIIIFKWHLFMSLLKMKGIQMHA
jgi:hypothetical protein